LESRASYISPYRSPKSIAATKEKNQKINNYLNNNFSSQFTSSETISYNKNTNTEYAWDLKYTEYVDSIIVHHTHSEYDDDLTGLNQIHKYHSINRQW
jgi:predicted secreted protein